MFFKAYQVYNRYHFYEYRNPFFKKLLVAALLALRGSVLEGEWGSKIA